ncbi:MAG: hypothetical protein RMI91_14795 [Gemmatales bacterium]|nr:hypothetical protein [Gemmatales bacterium]MDW7995912.1 hypothetical protein [Gemmatales bacterium]
MLRIPMIPGVFLWAALSTWGQDNWQVLEGPDKSFRVTGPGKPTYEKMPHRVAGKEIVVHSYLFIEIPYAFLLGYGDYPADYFAKRKVEDVLKLDQQRFLKNTGAKLVIDKLTRYQGKPAAEFVAHSEDNQSVYQVRMVLVGQRLYVLAVSFPVNADTKPVVRFLDSFQILEEKK